MRTQIELDLYKEEAELVTAPGSPAPSAASTAPAFSPSTKISLEKTLESEQIPTVLTNTW